MTPMDPELEAWLAEEEPKFFGVNYCWQECYSTDPNFPIVYGGYRRLTREMLQGRHYKLSWQPADFGGPRKPRIHYHDMRHNPKTYQNERIYFNLTFTSCS